MFTSEFPGDGFWFSWRLVYVYVRSLQNVTPLQKSDVHNPAVNSQKVEWY